MPLTWYPSEVLLQDRGAHMGLDRSRFALFFPQPMDAQDKANLATSGIKRIQLFLGVANNYPLQLDYLAGQGVRVTLRIEEPSSGQEAQSYYHAATHDVILSQIREVQKHIPVEAVIIGNEPEHDYDLSWQSGNWGNQPDQWYPGAGGKAQAHADAVMLLGIRLKMRGLGPVSPGWSHKRMTPRDPAQPGRATWRELCAPAYNRMDNGAHIYALNWMGAEDENRYLWALGNELERCHRAVWINETNVGAKDLRDLERMRAVIDVARLIGSGAWGNRVVSFCPFVSNGLANPSWGHMRIREPQAYAELRDWFNAD